MTAQRIVLTSPWKLGLFVFLLVAGTGFGLLYAYIELFGDQLKEVVSSAQSWDEKITLTGTLTIRDAYLVLGSIGLLSLIGYLAVIGSARPLDRVVRGSRKREQALKRLSGIEDPRELDLEDFEDEPALTHVLERWTIDTVRANDAQLDAAAQREALAGLAARIRDAANEGLALEAESHDPALNALVESINQFVRENAEALERSQDAEMPGTRGDAAWSALRDPVREAVRGLSAAEQELVGFVDSVAERAGQIAQVAQRLSQSDGSGSSVPVGSALESGHRAGDRLAQLRVTLDELAEQANKLAITMALQLSRLGDAGHEMIDSVEQVRTISTRYQRLVADLRLCETDQASTLQLLQHSGGAKADAQMLANLHQEAMGLDQNAEALREVLDQLRKPLSSLRTAVGESEPVAMARPVAAAVQPSPPRAMSEASGARTGRVDASGVTERSAEERIFEMAEFGGRRIATDEESEVYDLLQFGAVQI